MKITDSLLLKKLTPLATAVKQIDPAAYLGKSVYRLGGGIYFYLTEFGIPEVVSEGPYLSGVLCAPDDGAVMRATARHIEGDTGVTLTPPTGFLPSEPVLEYGGILNWLRSMQPNVCQETASYRISSDGLFVHRTIETERYTFYFRGADNDSRERPYAILHKF